ncbi:unnamed protein product [Effrenium voratum]|nr:unnamed protein product [Effrenium voratum]
MHHAGVAAATEAGIDPTQVDTIVSVSIQETEHSGAQKVTIPQDVIDNCMAAGEAAVDGPSAAAMVATIAGKLRGMSAADTARAARKCVYDAAIAKGMTPEQAAAAAEAAASTVASAVMRPANNSRLPPHPLERAGEDCWTACGKKSGLCAFCGIGNACCRKDELNPTKECRDIQTFHTWHHECVQPVHQPQDVNDVGHSVKEAVEYAKATGEAEKAVEETQAAGGGVESQVEAAGKAAAESVKEGGLNTADQVTSAYKSAEDAAKSAGMSAPEADAAAEKVSQEVAEAAGMTEQEAAAAAAAAAAVVHGRPLVKPTTAPQLPPQVAEEVPLKPPVVEPPAVPEAPEAATGETILPNPVPESIKEGIAAAETKKAENAPVHDQEQWLPRAPREPTLWPTRPARTLRRTRQRRQRSMWPTRMACPWMRPRARPRRPSRRRSPRRAATLLSSRFCRTQCRRPSRRASRRRGSRRHRTNPCTTRPWLRQAPLGPRPSRTKPPKKPRKTRRPRLQSTLPTRKGCPSTRPRARPRRRSRRRSTRRAATLWRIPSFRTRCRSPSRRASQRRRPRKRRPSLCTTRRWPLRAPPGPMPSQTKPARISRKTRRPRPRSTSPTRMGCPSTRRRARL